jgi:hypothetical protein
MALALTCAAIVPAAPAGAIVGGQPTGPNQFRNVVMIRATDGATGQNFRCSGTLVDANTVLTAAHCTQGAINARVTFDDTPDDGNTVYIPGTAHGSPLFDNKLRNAYLYDIGVVELSGPAPAGVSPAKLPAAGYLDDTRPIKKDPFEVVGYGIRWEKVSGTGAPDAVTQPIVRNWTTATLQNVSGETVLIQGNPNDSRNGGGICSGDSGGPLLHKGTVVGVTSWGGSTYCRSNGGFQRTDTEFAREFLSDYVTLP